MKQLIIASLLLSTFCGWAAQSSEVPPPLMSARRGEAVARSTLLKQQAMVDLKGSLGVTDYKYAVNLVDSFPFNVTAGGGATLHADATYPTPNPANPSEKFPLVIFPNSWGTPEIEYILKILNISTTGYVCVEYETRGWYDSTGFIDTAGPFDRSDGSELIDLILNNFGSQWQIDASKIAFGGISYGAGISLMMAGYDSRVKTAMSLSGWGSLTTSMYHNQSPSKSAINILVDSAADVGNPSPELFTLRTQLLQHVNMSSVIAYSNNRSPDMFLTNYKSRDTPIFMSNNYLDRFFDPQGNAAFWSQIDVTNKFMLFNNGPHAIAEVLGVADIQDYVWTRGQEWLDAILKGINNGILTGPRVQMQHGNSIFSYDYNMYNNIPSPYVAMSLTPRGADTAFGGLQTVEGMGRKEGRAQVAKKVRTGKKAPTPTTMEELRAAMKDRLPKSLKNKEAVVEEILAANMKKVERTMKGQSLKATDGVAACSPSSVVAGADVTAQNTINYNTSVILNQGSDIWRAFGFESSYPLNNVDPSSSLVFVSQPLTADQDLCGFPEITGLTVIPKLASTGNLSTNFQLYVFLYDVDSSCSGNIISDGLYTRWYDSVTPLVNPTTGAYTVNSLEMRGICVSIPAGHRIGLGVVLYSEHFQPSTTDLSATFDYSTMPTLKLPLA